MQATKIRWHVPKRVTEVDVTTTAIDVMSEEHEAHLQRVKDVLCAQLDAKYRKGQIEHGGRLWEKPGMLEHAIEEAIDLCVYLLTLREQELRRASDRSGTDSVQDVSEVVVHGHPI